MKKYICIDIGGTSIKHGVLEGDFQILEKEERPTESLEKGGAGIVAKVLEIVDYWQTRYTLSGVAISTAGIVDPQCGKIIYSCDLIPGYTGTELKKLVEEHSGLPCSVENDVNCAGLAESQNGAGTGAKICLCLTVGTGIGGCLVIDGDVFRGFSGSACEVGYMTVKNGTLQELGATSVLVKKVAEARGASEGAIDGKVIFEEACAGTPDCVKAIDEMVAVLAEGIANMVYVINPEVVVLGGGIMAQRDYLEAPLKCALKERIIPEIYKNTRIDFAKNGNDAGMIGALIHFIKKQDEKMR